MAIESYAHRAARDIIVNWMERTRSGDIKTRWAELVNRDIGRITTCSHIWENGEPHEGYPYVDICVYDAKTDRPILAIDLIHQEHITVDKVSRVCRAIPNYRVFPVFWILELNAYMSSMNYNYSNLEKQTQEELDENINHYAPLPCQYVGWGD